MVKANNETDESRNGKTHAMIKHRIPALPYFRKLSGLDSRISTYRSRSGTNRGPGDGKASPYDVFRLSVGNGNAH
jgi:hypothetical protein